MRRQRNGWARLAITTLALGAWPTPIAFGQNSGDDAPQEASPRAKAGPADPDIRQPRPRPQVGPPITDPVERQRAMADVSPERCRRESLQSKEIVVCADPEGREKYRIPPKLREAETSIRDGLPRAPNVYGIPDLGGVKIGGCFLQACPPPVYYFDVTKLPEPPAGSDADRISKGELKAD